MLDSSAAPKGDKTPIVIVIPGLTSDSAAAVSYFFLFRYIDIIYICSLILSLKYLKKCCCVYSM